MARPLPPLLSITPASMAVAANAMTGGIPLPERDDSWELQSSVRPAGEARWEELQCWTVARYAGAELELK